MVEKVLYIIRGLPGSGKTTLAQALAKKHSLIFSEDDYYYESDGDLTTYNWTSAKEKIAKKQCLEAVKKALEMGYKQVFVTNVFLTQKDVEPYLKAAEKHKYRTHVLIAQNTHGNVSIHNVKPKDFERMQNRFEIWL